MNSTSFEPTPAMREGTWRRAVMWTYHGREFPAPTFELGHGPGRQPVLDRDRPGRSSCPSCSRAEGPGGPILKPETLEGDVDAAVRRGGRERRGFGLGFILAELDGHASVGHGGAIYGFATEFAALPDDKLGVVVVVVARRAPTPSRTRIADAALRLMLAAKDGKPLPTIETTEPAAEPDAPRSWPAATRDGDETAVELTERDGRLYLLPAAADFRLELRAGPASDLVVDDVARLRARLIAARATRSQVGERRLRADDRTADARAPQAGWRGLIGEYGWDHNTLFILEKDGQLHALIEWVLLDPLRRNRENVFAFPRLRPVPRREAGLHARRDGPGDAGRGGRASSSSGGKIDGEDGETFRIKPVRPSTSCAPSALAAKPPAETGEFREPDLVDLTTLDPTIKLDIRYATDEQLPRHAVLHVGAGASCSGRPRRRWRGSTRARRSRATAC